MADDEEGNALATIRHRVVFSSENFDDYWISLMAKVRSNDDADSLISGETFHPLHTFQNANSSVLQRLGIRTVRAPPATHPGSNSKLR